MDTLDGLPCITNIISADRISWSREEKIRVWIRRENPGLVKLLLHKMVYLGLSAHVLLNEIFAEDNTTQHYTKLSKQLKNMLSVQEFQEKGRWRDFSLMLGLIVCLFVYHGRPVQAHTMRKLKSIAFPRYRTNVKGHATFLKFCPI